MKQIKYLRISKTGKNETWDYEVIGEYKRIRCYNLSNKDLSWKLENFISDLKEEKRHLRVDFPLPLKGYPSSQKGMRKAK